MPGKSSTKEKAEEKSACDVKSKKDKKKAMSSPTQRDNGEAQEKDKRDDSESSGDKEKRHGKEKKIKRKHRSKSPEERSRSRSRSKSRSRSRSYSRSRRHRSRSTSHKRRRRSYSRSYSRSVSRSRSRSPYSGHSYGMRRGRGGFRGFSRFPRGRRPYRGRGQYGSHSSFQSTRRYYSRSRSRSRSRSGNRSRSRTPSHSGSRSPSHSKTPSSSESRSKSRSPDHSPSPRPPVKDTKRASPFHESSESSEEDALSSPLKVVVKSQVTQLKPTDIKESQKKATQTFLAMLEEKRKKHTMIPIVISTKPKEIEGSDDSKKDHGFVSTFISLKPPGSQSKELLSADLEDDGWQVVDDAENDSASGRKRERSEKKLPLTAKALLERKRQNKKIDGGESSNSSVPKSSSASSSAATPTTAPSSGAKQSSLDPKAMVGKVKMAKKSFVSRRAAVKKEEKTSLNSDYSWYQQYYANAYGLDAYSAAYSAYYTMVTGGDYTQKDLSEWMTEIGYTQPVFYDSLGDLKVDMSEFKAKQPPLPKTPPLEHAQDPADAQPEAVTVEEPQAIKVCVADVPSCAKDMFYQDYTALARDEDTDDMEVESDCESLPPPRTPPLPPLITVTTITQAIILPDGTELPAGTKQTIVHPQTIAA